MTRSLPPLRDVLTSLVATTWLVALVVDLFGTNALDVAKEFNVSPYIFYPTNAMVVSLVLHLPKLDETVSCECRDLPELVKLPENVATIRSSQNLHLVVLIIPFILLQLSTK
ncbi:hydroquinone glucosyltransferase [Quercus suber]|uniref:Hydroquinone glucosyltransferase n=1 Tax=Quercus suber TaxID=58331 RepID=A0AAW0JBD1_QUESU|nr:hydroquinone glucosyltransferase [Quercus suber]